MSMIVCEDCRWPIYTKKETAYPQREWSLNKGNATVSKGFMGYKCKQCEGD